MSYDQLISEIQSKLGEVRLYRECVWITHYTMEMTLICSFCLILTTFICFILYRCIYRMSIFRLQNDFIQTFIPSSTIIHNNSTKFKATLKPCIDNDSIYSGSYCIVLKQLPSKRLSPNPEFMIFPLKRYTLDEAKEWENFTGIRIENYQDCVKYKLMESDRLMQQQIKKHLIKENNSAFKDVGNNILTYLYPDQLIDKTKNQPKTTQVTVASQQQKME